MKPRSHGKVTVFALALIFLAGLGFYVWQYTSGQVEPPVKAEPPGPSLEQQFETVLNDFLADMADQMDSYQKRRRVMINLIKPENLREPLFVKENYEMMEMLAPTLEQKMNEVMAVFADADKKINALVSDQPAEKRDVILGEWEALKKKQATPYTEFFALEQDILDSYQELISFYYTKSGEFEVGTEKQEVVFTDSADQEKQQKMLDHIKDLHVKQAMILKQS